MGWFETLSQDEWLKHVDQHMDFINEVLTDRGLPISRRPWAAAFFFVEHMILEFSGTTREEFIKSTAFEAIVARSHRWYAHRYGEGVLRQEAGKTSAIVMLLDVPFELEVPLTLTKPTRRGDLVALHLPRKVLWFEDPLGFLKTPPNLERLGAKTLSQVKRRISTVAGQLRRIHTSAMFAKLGEAEGLALATGMLRSLEKGAADISSQDQARLSSAVWELNYAAEQAIKAFLWQKSRPVPKSHTVADLVSLAEKRGLPLVPRTWKGRFPEAGDAVRYRYGELGIPHIFAVAELYRVTLLTVLHAASNLARGVHIGGSGAVIYIKPLLA